MEREGTQENQSCEQGTGTSRSLMRPGGAGRALLRLALPFSYMRRLTGDLDALVVDERAGHDRRIYVPGKWVPLMEVAEREGQLIIRAEVPGITTDQLRVDLEDGRLVISGERKQDLEEKRGWMYRSERSYGRFTRVIGLPQGTAVDQATATFTNGVVEVTLPAPPRRPWQVDRDLRGSGAEAGALAGPSQHTKGTRP